MANGASSTTPFTPAELADIAGKTPEQWIKLAYDSVPASVTDPVQQSEIAWKMLQSLRRPGDPAFADFNHDFDVPTVPGADKFVNLAYAEHYAFARYSVAKTGDLPGQIVLIYGYEANKKKKFMFGESDDLKLGPYEPSPPSMEAVKYAQKGADDGLKDFRKKNPDKFVPVGEAFRENEELMGKQSGVPSDWIKSGRDTSAKIQSKVDQDIKGLQADAGKLQKAADKATRDVSAKIQRAIDQAKKILDNAKKAWEAEAKRLKNFKPSDVGEVSEPCKKPEQQVETSVSAKIIGGSGGAGGAGKGK